MSNNINLSNEFKKIMTGMLHQCGLYGKISKRYYDEELILLEENIKQKDGYTYKYQVLISQDIKEMLESNSLLDKVLKIALVEIIPILNEEIDKNYIIEVDIEIDSEFPQWRYTLITIKTSITDSKYIINLWKLIEGKVREKIKYIDEDIEEIKKINRNLSIFIEILEE